MIARNICQIKGDGIGTEVVPVAVNVLKYLFPDLNVAEANAGWNTFQQTGNSVPPETFDTIKECGAAIFGAVSSPSQSVENYQSAILKIRQGMDLFANIRPVDSRFSRHKTDNFRFVIVRENSEGLYARQEEAFADGSFAKKIVTKKASRRIAQAALDIARIYQIDRITIVHKANILPQTDGLFLETVRQFIQEKLQKHETICIDQMLVDTCALKVVEEPEQFGVIVTTNLYGDILSDVAAYWCGGLQMAPSINIGPDVEVCEPVHGSAPDIAGRGIADPRAAILSAALLCRFQWNDSSTSDQIESAVAESIRNCDSAKTADIENSVLEHLKSVHDHI